MEELEETEGFLYVVKTSDLQTVVRLAVHALHDA